MTETTLLLNTVVSYGGLILLAASGVLLFDLFTSRSLQALVRAYANWMLLVLSTFGVILTLVYSEVFGFVPCGLCWLQRLFLYPLPILLATGMCLKDASVRIYTMVLVSPGFVIALYQHYLQMGGTELVGCPVAGGDCAQRILFEFGFMTFPLLSAILFFFLFTLAFYQHRVS